MSASRPQLVALDSAPCNDAATPAPVEPLVAAVLAGDEAAMHALGMRVLPRVRNAVRYLVRGDRIDDMVQDVLVTIIERLASFAGTGRFESWVDGVTVRVVIGRMRKQRTTQRREAPLVVEQHESRAEDPAGMLRYATSRQLVRALDRLSDNHRSALCLHHVFGWTVPEIASELDVPHETVRTRLRDGMGQLRVLLRVTPAGRPGQS
jgi:RNA polymerase sigma-70 factor, ECF subfamily